MVSYFDDDLLPGDGLTPEAQFKLTELERVMVGGKEELLFQVRMRKSDLSRGQLEFKIPVYAVNDKGEHMTNANGLFNAKFSNLTGGSSDCGDCVMVGGVAYINVRINPYSYSMANPDSKPMELELLQIWAITK